jgi:membrane dipeptidase
MIKLLVQKGAVIGMALDAWMLVPNWIRGKSTPNSTGCNLDKVADNIDHICQLAGNALHVGIGTDLDGAFGTEQCPLDVNTIADLQTLLTILKNRGYSESDLVSISHGNFISFLKQALP